MTRTRKLSQAQQDVPIVSGDTTNGITVMFPVSSIRIDVRRYDSTWTVLMSANGFTDYSLDSAGAFLHCLRQARYMAGVFVRVKDLPAERTTVLSMALALYGEGGK